MNKKIISFVLALSSAAAVTTGVLADDEITVLVNGTAVEFEDQAPFIENDRTLVPMRAIFEALGAYVDWDEETRTVVSYDPVSDVSITMQADSNVMFVGEKEVTLDVPAKIVNDRTVVPVRAVAEGMNSVVDWDEATRTVIVEKELNVEVPNPWTEYKSLNELNEALQSAEGVKYTVTESKIDNCEVTAYRYLSDANMAEIIYTYTDDDKKCNITVRKQPGDADISGISGGTKVEEYTVGNSLVEVYSLDNTVYAVWSSEDETIYSNSVAVSGDAKTDVMTEILKTIVQDVETNSAKG